MKFGRLNMSHTFCRTTLAIALIVITVLANDGAIPVYANGGSPIDSIVSPPNDSGLLKRYTGGDTNVRSTAYGEEVDNPWGCEGVSHRPHESKRDPGLGWIQAKSDIDCTVAPPVGSEWSISQRLYRSSWRGWVKVKSKYSSCPDGIGAPDCEPDFMRAYINWRCSQGAMYNYRVKARHELIVDDIIYRYDTSHETGAWWEDGRVQCTR